MLPNFLNAGLIGSSTFVWSGINGFQCAVFGNYFSDSWVVLFLGLPSLGLPSLFFVLSTTPQIWNLSFIACINISFSFTFFTPWNSLQDNIYSFNYFTFIFLIVDSERSTDVASTFFAASASLSGSVVATYLLLNKLIQIVNFSW